MWYEAKRVSQEWLCRGRSASCRLVAELTRAIQAQDEPPPATAAAASRTHKLTDLLRQAGQLLSDMRREGEGAADAIFAMIDVMDDDDYEAPRGQTALVPVLPAPQLLLPEELVSPRMLSVDPGARTGREQSAGPLQVVAGKLSPLPGDQDPVGVAEKVAWMDTKSQAPAQGDQDGDGVHEIVGPGAGAVPGWPNLTSVLALFSGPLCWLLALGSLGGTRRRWSFELKGQQQFHVSRGQET